MSASDQIRVNDIGTTLRFTIKDGPDVVNISAATTKQLIFTKPNGVVLTKDATFLTDGSDGILYYTAIAGDLDTCGIWQAQAYLVFPSSSYKTSIIKFTVHRNLS